MDRIPRSRLFFHRRALKLILPFIGVGARGSIRSARLFVLVRRTALGDHESRFAARLIFLADLTLPPRSPSLYSEKSAMPPVGNRKEKMRTFLSIDSRGAAEIVEIMRW